jgi:hypothetical protein
MPVTCPRGGSKFSDCNVSSSLASRKISKNILEKGFLLKIEPFLKHTAFCI